MAPNAGAVRHREHQRGTNVVRRKSARRRRNARRFNVPAARFCCHAGDSGKRRIRISGIAGMTPDITCTATPSADRDRTLRPKPADGWQARAVRDAQPVGRGNHQSSHRGERLCVAEHRSRRAGLGESSASHPRRDDSTQTPTTSDPQHQQHLRGRRNPEEKQREAHRSGC